MQVAAERGGENATTSPLRPVTVAFVFGKAVSAPRRAVNIALFDREGKGRANWVTSLGVQDGRRASETRRHIPTWNVQVVALVS